MITKLFRYIRKKFFDKDVIYSPYIPIYKTVTIDNKSIINKSKIFVERKVNAK